MRRWRDTHAGAATQNVARRSRGIPAAGMYGLLAQWSAGGYPVVVRWSRFRLQLGLRERVRKRSIPVYCMTSGVIIQYGLVDARSVR